MSVLSDKSVPQTKKRKEGENDENEEEENEEKEEKQWCVTHHFSFFFVFSVLIIWF